MNQLKSSSSILNFDRLNLEDYLPTASVQQPHFKLGLVSHWCCYKTLGGLNHCNTVYHVLVGGIDSLSITSTIAELTAAARECQKRCHQLESDVNGTGGGNVGDGDDNLIVIETLRTTKGKNQASNITLRSFLVASGNSPAWFSPSGDFALGFHHIDG
ncbi:hypothetical protein T459_02716 [Capsicum annuum]|uniref:Uncharacterized protein n=1 Tax=Capsicum annuum TaxID=4072 RepID=A0A2G3AKS3_CAPAN|nr:hypothetical protein T459_02716 [Capsicum annuum]